MPYRFRCPGRPWPPRSPIRRSGMACPESASTVTTWPLCCRYWGTPSTGHAPETDRSWWKHRSEERRVGKEWKTRWAGKQDKEKNEQQKEERAGVRNAERGRRKL